MVTTLPTAYSKQLYKLSEVSAMLSLPPSTINYWVYTFDELDPPTTKGGHRRYRPQDIELVKQIKVMMHDKGMQIEGAKRMLKKSRVPYRGFKCESAGEAISLLREISDSMRENPRAQAMADAVAKWVEIYAAPKRAEYPCGVRAGQIEDSS